MTFPLVFAVLGCIARPQLVARSTPSQLPIVRMFAHPRRAEAPEHRVEQHELGMIRSSSLSRPCAAFSSASERPATRSIADHRASGAKLVGAAMSFAA